jgi:hypothetical protein
VDLISGSTSKSNALGVVMFYRIPLIHEGLATSFEHLSSSAIRVAPEMERGQLNLADWTIHSV